MFAGRFLPGGTLSERTTGRIEGRDAVLYSRYQKGARCSRISFVTLQTTTPPRNCDGDTRNSSSRRQTIRLSTSGTLDTRCSSLVGFSRVRPEASRRRGPSYRVSRPSSSECLGGDGPHRERGGELLTATERTTTAWWCSHEQQPADRRRVRSPYPPEGGLLTPTAGQSRTDPACHRARADATRAPRRRVPREPRLLWSTTRRGPL